MPDPTNEYTEAADWLEKKAGSGGPFVTMSDGRVVRPLPTMRHDDSAKLESIAALLRKVGPLVEALEEYADVDSWCCFECGGEYDTCNCKVDQWIPTEHGYELAQQALAAFENRSKS